jgi:hypothetical protein
MGPAHGAQTTPRASPVKNPGQNPVLVFGAPNLPESAETNPSTIRVNGGITRVKPKNKSITTATSLKIFASKPIIWTRYEIERVITPNETRIPRVNPRGLLCPPKAELDKTIGRSGHMHGAAIVTSPDIKAKKSKIGINYILYHKHISI